MATETQVVKEFVRRMKQHPEEFSGWSSRYLLGLISRALKRDDLPGGIVSFYSVRPERNWMASRLERRIRKKLAQPFRRKKRGPLRRKAAGKNEVRGKFR